MNAGIRGSPPSVAARQGIERAWAKLAGVDRALLEEAIRDAGPRVFEAGYRAMLRETLCRQFGASQGNANALVNALAALAYGRRLSK